MDDLAPAIPRLPICMRFRSTRSIEPVRFSQGHHGNPVSLNIRAGVARSRNANGMTQTAEGVETPVGTPPVLHPSRLHRNAGSFVQSRPPAPQAEIEAAVPIFRREPRRLPAHRPALIASRVPRTRWQAFFTCSAIRDHHGRLVEYGPRSSSAPRPRKRGALRKSRGTSPFTSTHTPTELKLFRDP